MTTPHINAKKGDFTETVLFPGDPLRAKFIAENFLTDVVQICNVRNMLGFRGKYLGKDVSIMPSGMGIPSCTIYATELIKSYGVKNIIRVGTAGGLPGSNTKLKDIILAIGASTDSNINRCRFSNFDLSAVCDFDLLHHAFKISKKQGKEVKVGSCLTSDYFYPSYNQDFLKNYKSLLCVEMESAGLYGLALEYNVRALSLLTVSDLVGNNKEIMTSEERVNSLNSVIELALETAISFE